MALDLGPTLLWYALGNVNSERQGGFSKRQRKRAEATHEFLRQGMQRLAELGSIAVPLSTQRLSSIFELDIGWMLTAIGTEDAMDGWCGHELH